MGEISLRDEHGRFARGHSGNLKGRPVGVTVYEAVQKLLRVVDGKGVMRVDRIAAALVRKMESADAVSVAMIMDREDPKVVRNLNQDVHSFEAGVDKFISDMMATPEGEERLAAMKAEAWREIAPAPPVGPPNDQVREDGSIVDE